jgi:hypothetical protein
MGQFMLGFTPGLTSSTQIALVKAVYRGFGEGTLFFPI